jgi:mono/diheme cytochrome c family protein
MFGLCPHEIFTPLSGNVQTSFKTVESRGRKLSTSSSAEELARCQTSEEEIMRPNENQCHKFAGLPLLIGAAVFAALAIAVQASAQQTTSNAPGTGAQVTLKHVQIKPVPANDGREMYVAYCAVCHGATAKGDGPAAPALKNRPTDLTMLAAQNGGTFPWHHVRYVLTAIEPPNVEGSADMPNWCPAFRSLDRGNSAATFHRVRNLVSYLKTLQVPSTNDLRADVVGGHRR